MVKRDDKLEAERLKALHGYEILDTPPDGSFDRVTALAAKLFDVPIALVSLVDEDRIWFKSRFGLEELQIPRTPGLCASAIFSDEAYVVKNAVEDPRTLANPLVSGALGLRFYAAAPLITHDGYRLGTINIIDFEPRPFNAQDEAALKLFAGIVMDQMELRLSARKTLSSLSRLFRQAKDLSQIITVCAWTHKVQIEGEWLTFDQFLTRKLGLMVSHGIHPDAEKSLQPPE